MSDLGFPLPDPILPVPEQHAETDGVPAWSEPDDEMFHRFFVWCSTNEVQWLKPEWEHRQRKWVTDKFGSPITGWRRPLWIGWFWLRNRWRLWREP